MPGDVQNNEKSYLVVRYIPDLSWYLLVKQDTGALLAELNEKMLETVVFDFGGDPADYSDYHFGDQKVQRADDEAAGRTAGAVQGSDRADLR